MYKVSKVIIFPSSEIIHDFIQFEDFLLLFLP